MSANIISDIIEELPKEIIKEALKYFITILLILISAGFYTYKSYLSLFPFGFNDIDVHARLKGKASPGETIELYPPSRTTVVTNSGEAKWKVPFDEVASKTIELHRLKTSGGKLSRDVLVQQEIGGSPVILFVLEK